MYKYTLWGNIIESDIELDLNDKNIKNQFILARVQIDKTGAVTERFKIKNGKIKIFPFQKDLPLYHKYLKSHDEPINNYVECIFSYSK